MSATRFAAAMAAALTAFSIVSFSSADQATAVHERQAIITTQASWLFLIAAPIGGSLTDQPA
jgi:hypothetical protein